MAVILVGLARREVANEPPPAKGGFASRPMVARLVRYGPVRQKKTFLDYRLNCRLGLSYLVKAVLVQRERRVSLRPVLADPKGKAVAPL